MFEQEIAFIKARFHNKERIALHEPLFIGKEKEYLNACMDSGFVSSVGEFVGLFEKEIAKYCGAREAVAMNSGTSALHIALLSSGVSADSEVITQALSFVATANAIAYTGAKPVFLDIDEVNLSLSPSALKDFLSKHTFIRDKACFNKHTNKHIKACVVMHTFGLAAHIKELKALCEEHFIDLIEDAAEALGSFYEKRALGTFGKCGILSFNGNKIITGGCGGVLLTDDEALARRARHLSTTAKLAHAYEYEHDALGYNYRLCNVNAAILCAQLENLDLFLKSKRELAREYKDFFKDHLNFKFVDEIPNSQSNFWLCALIAKDGATRDAFLQATHAHQIYTRPVWKCLAHLKMYKRCQNDGLKNTLNLEKRIVNLPSSARISTQEYT